MFNTATHWRSITSHGLIIPFYAKTCGLKLLETLSLLTFRNLPFSLTQFTMFDIFDVNRVGFRWFIEPEQVMKSMIK